MISFEQNTNHFDGWLSLGLGGSMRAHEHTQSGCCPWHWMC